MEQTKIRQTEKDQSDKELFGFWIYLMTDLIMFAVLFATYAVLHNNTFGGPKSYQIYSLPLAMCETLILLTSSFTCGLSMVFARNRQKEKTLLFLFFTFLLGLSFLAIELSEFSKLIAEGTGPDRSAFLSSFFTLVGTHGLHIFAGLLWLLILFIYLAKHGLTKSGERKLTLFSLFWHFLDLVWVFIFTIVYLMGVL